MKSLTKNRIMLVFAVALAIAPALGVLIHSIELIKPFHTLNVAKDDLYTKQLPRFAAEHQLTPSQVQLMNVAMKQAATCDASRCPNYWESERGSRYISLPLAARFYNGHTSYDVVLADEEQVQGMLGTVYYPTYAIYLHNPDEAVFRFDEAGNAWRQLGVDWIPVPGDSLSRSMNRTLAATILSSR